MDTRKRKSRKNPEETSNFLSALCFGWTSEIFWNGVRRDLQITDLYDPLKSDESERLGDRLEREWKKELMKADQESKLIGSDDKKPRKRPNLTAAITRMIRARYMKQGVLLLVQAAVLRIAQPIFQGWIIGYFDPGQNMTTLNQALFYAGLLMLTTLGVVFITHHTGLRTREIGMSIRVACCSLIYRKVLRLNQTTVNNKAAGIVTNLISNDVARFDLFPFFFHHIWIMPIQITMMGYVMWQSIGVATLVGIAAIMVQNIPMQCYLGYLSSKLRSKIAVQTDERVQLMKELISGIQIVKMYAWERPFESIISQIRALEIKLVTLTSYLRAFCFSVFMISERLSLYLTLLTFVLMGEPLTAEITFLIMTLFNVLQFTCVIAFPQALLLSGEVSVSLERLTDFLLLDEVKYSKNVPTGVFNGLQNFEKNKKASQVENGVGIVINKVAANWVHGHLPPSLCGISLELKSRSLSVLVGPVGSGKSSLLHLLLGELPVGVGSLSFFNGMNVEENKLTSEDIRISYTSQDPWLFSASIRDNILFGQAYDKKRYQEVVSVCALLKDFEQLAEGDLTYVGERGVSLSGGQRARVNLARAVYRDADLYLLDDPLSAVDTRVSRHLFEECIQGFLKDKTRILATHQLQYLQQADTVVVLDHGTVECHGTYAELSKSHPHIFISEQSDESEEIEHIVESHDESKVTAVTDEKDQLSENIEKKEEPKDVKEEEMATGQMSNKIYWAYLSAGGSVCFLTFTTIIFIISQIAASGTDYWITYWTNQETLRVALQLNKSDTDSATHSNDTVNNDMPSLNFVITQWFDEFGLILPTPAFYIYTFCVVSCIFFIILRSTLFMRMCVQASRNMHDYMFSNVLQATMRFFNTNPSGRILNRFSKDVGTMDELLPKTAIETIQIFALMTGLLVMIIIANIWFILPTILMIFIFHTLRIYYLKTAQDVKRLECITKSPVFSHVSSTLDGLTTIRSRGPSIEELLRKEFDRYQDTHTGAWYLTIATAAAFGLVLDLVSCCFIACVCFTFILTNDENTLPGFVGLAISQSLVLTGTIQYGFKQAAELITQMTSVERVLQYTNLPKEGPFVTDNPPPPSWPSNGGLLFKNVSMKYAAHESPVLKDLNVNIKPGWKIGVVGRTGAGKSSLISALFRMTGDGLEGEIIVDGIDTKTIGLHELRPRISIIPQEPILFSASLRYNLDPFEQYSDTELWDILREVELAEAVPSLSFQVAGGGANFSVGQRQLICLARAILKNNRILVLDEATANVDPSTDAVIQKTIRRRFADCTLLTIAHRLNTIMDSDRVLVMEGGRIVEFGHPYLLLKNTNGHFSRMLKQTGKVMTEKLAEIAESAYRMNVEFEEELNDEEVISDREITYL